MDSQTQYTIEALTKAVTSLLELLSGKGVTPIVHNGANEIRETLELDLRVARLGDDE